MKLNAYLHFNGNCEEALNFYQEVLGAKQLMMLRYGDSPAADETAKELQNKIIHGRIAIGEGIIMGSDAPTGRYQAPGGFSVNIGVETPEEAERIFKALSEKGTIHMPMEETFWALRFGMFIDRFGTPWMINCEKKS
jgi:PhnB protein